MVDVRGEIRAELAELSRRRFVDCQRMARSLNADLFRAWDMHLERAVCLRIARSPEAALAEQASERPREHGIREGMRRMVEELGRAPAVGRYTLLREARLLARIDHPRVVAVLDIGRFEDGAVGVVMPPLEDSLAERELDGRWPQTLELALAIGEGLAAIHDAGLLHRNLSRASIRFDAEGRARIAELSRGCREDDEQALAEWVSPEAYAAPEVLEQRAYTRRSEVYAYCALVFELFYGHPAHASPGARTRGELSRSQHEGGIPPGLRELLARGLEPDPARRWSDMHALLRALARVGAPSSRRWGTLALSMVAAASVALGVFAATQPVRAGVCDDPLYELASMWDAETRDELRGALGTRKVGDAMESWVNRWVAVRGQECERAQRAGVEPRASSCTSSARERFEATLHAFLTPHLREGLNYASVVAELPAPEHCLEHPDALQNVGSGLIELRDEEMRAEVSIKLGELEEARAAQEEYMRVAQALNSDYGYARAVYWRGELHRREQEYEAASAAFEEALEHAHRLDAELFAAEVHMRMLELAGEQGEHAAVRANAVAARTILRAHQPDRVAELLQLEGLALIESGDQDTRDQGLDALQRAVELREDQLQRFGGTREHLSQAQESYARGLLALGRPLEALRYVDSSLDIHQDEFGHGTWRKYGLLRLRLEALVQSDKLELAKDVHNKLLVISAANKNWHRFYEDTVWMAELYATQDGQGWEEWALITVRGNQAKLDAVGGHQAEVEELEMLLIEMGY